MTDITEAARAEVRERHPVWRDSGVGIKQAARYRDGFVAGAEWCDARSRAALDRAIAEWTRAKEQLIVARELTKLEAAARLNPFTHATRERLVLQVADIIDD